jgi:transposase
MWVEQCLISTSRFGDIVVLDNLGSDKGQAVRRAIRNAGARLLFPPPYGPILTHQASLRKTQNIKAQSYRGQHRRNMEWHRQCPQCRHAKRMQNGIRNTWYASI